MKIDNKIKEIIPEVWNVDYDKQLASEVTARAKKISTYMQDKEYRSAVQSYEDIQLYMWKRYLDNLKWWFWWSSNEKYPLIANAWRTFSWIMSKLDINKVAISTYLPNNKSASTNINHYKSLVKYFWSKHETKQSISQAIDEALAVWTGYIKVAWKKIKKRVVKKVSTVNGEKVVDYQDIDYWYPILKYVSYFNVIRDLNPECRYIGEKYYMTKQQLIESYGKLDFEKLDKWTKLFTQDYNKVKNIWVRDVEVRKKTENCLSNQLRGASFNHEDIPAHDDWYNLDTNWLYEVLDIYINWYECTYNVVMVNGEAIVAWESTNPFPWSPIIQLNFMSMPWEIFGKWLWWMWRWYQSSVDTLYNSYLNSIKILTNPMFTMDETMSQMSKQITYAPRSVMSTATWVNTLEKLQLVKSEDTQNNLNAISTIEAKFNSDLGLNSYLTWWSWWIERSAEWVRQKKAGSDNKIAKFLDNISEFYSESMEKLVTLQKVFWDKELSFDELWKEINLNIWDILIWYKITFDWEDILWEKAAKNQELLSLINAIWPIDKDEVTNETFTNRRKIIEKIFSNVDMYDVIYEDEERIADIKQKVEFMKLKAQELSALSWPTDPFDKQNMSITISWKDLMDIPEAREKILASIWIDIKQQPQQPQQQAPTENISLPRQPQEVIWRPMNIWGNAPQ